MTTCVIVEGVRSPIGRFKGKLSRMSAVEMGAAVGRSLLMMTNIDKHQVDELLMGSVLTAGQGQAPARQVALKMGLPDGCPATTVNKICGSGMKSVMLACDQILSGQGSVYLAGGMESMTRAPYLLPQMREGVRFGDQKILDHMMLDGLQDPSCNGAPMGVLAEKVAGQLSIGREEQDDFALSSLERAQKATKEGLFHREIVPLSLQLPKEEIELDHDEQLDYANPEKLKTLKPSFDKNGTITAGNASALADGAAMLLVMSEEKAKELGLPIRAYIRGYAQAARTPEEFTIAPLLAIPKLLKKVSWDLKEVDLFEVNEAFATVPLACMKEFNIAHDKVNVNGGACAMGHPIGASSARILVTLMNALEQKGVKKGLATACIGGGEATAMALELA